jgi:hypothetical protein
MTQAWDMNSLDIKWIGYTGELLKTADGLNAMICDNAISEKTIITTRYGI